MNYEIFKQMIIDPAMSKEEQQTTEYTAYILSKIIKKRLQLGITQTQLAKKVGMTQSSIARIENLKGGIPKLDTLMKIASALDLKMILVDSSVASNFNFDTSNEKATASTASEV